jgi:uncharacterized membrane-anchored protein
MIVSDPRRDAIWQELHARPYVRFSGPAHVFRYTFFLGDEPDEAPRKSLRDLTEKLGLAATYETGRHAIYAGSIPKVGRLVVSWERHSEFVAFTFYVYELQIPFRPFELDPEDLLPAGWLASVGTPPLVATRLAVGSVDEMPRGPAALVALFEGHTVNGSRVMGGRAEVWSCYRVHRDGYGRIAVATREMSPRELGRTVERLLAIEDWYYLTLLSLPIAREVKPEVAAAERRMVSEMDALRGADSLEQKRTVLDALLGLAADVEHLRARVTNRFSASAAYFSLLESRFLELREEKIEHVLSLSRFVMRRVRPAAATCRSLLERLADLSERIDRAADLLRTRIELHLDEQNVRLLESADRRARLQLRLQEAFEGLSVFVIAYYALSLAGFALRALQSRGFPLDVDATLGLLLPFVLAAVAAAAYLIRRQFRDHQ